LNSFGFSVPIRNNFGSTTLSITYAKFHKLLNMDFQYGVLL